MTHRPGLVPVRGPVVGDRCCMRLKWISLPLSLSLFLLLPTSPPLLQLLDFMFLMECIWAWMKASIDQLGHLSTHLRGKKRRFIRGMISF